jgi:FKBP-type peptidyl-prolyl cis-trans isomerase FkpA
MIKPATYLLLLLIFFSSCGNKENSDQQILTKQLTSKNLVEVNRILIKKDQQKIIGYINRKGWIMEETETGLWYQLLENGKGIKAIPGKLATIEYTLTLLDGKTCYSSEKSGVKTFLIGKGNVESGLEQGILLLNEGSKARLILPPHLAYGLPGDGNCIPARAILIYELKLISLTNP